MKSIMTSAFVAARDTFMDQLARLINVCIPIPVCTRSHVYIKRAEYILSVYPNLT